MRIKFGSESTRAEEVPPVVSGDSAGQFALVTATEALPPKAEYLELVSTSLSSSAPSPALLLAKGAGLSILLFDSP